MPTSVNLVNSVLEKKPSEFKADFSTMMQDRIRDIVAARQVAVAGGLLGNVPENEEVPDDTTGSENTEASVEDTVEDNTDPQPDEEPSNG